MRRVDYEFDYYPDRTKNVTGVYAITHKGVDVYVGSSTRVVSRIDHHRWSLATNRHKSKRFQQFWFDNCGKEFGSRVIVYCDKSRLLELERVHSEGKTLLNSLVPGCAYPDFVRDNISSASKHKPKSDAHRAALSEAQRKRFQNPEQRKLCARGAAALHEKLRNSPALREKQIEAIKRAQTPSAVKKRSESLKAFYAKKRVLSNEQ